MYTRALRLIFIIRVSCHQGRVSPPLSPDNWMPHVTIGRCYALHLILSPTRRLLPCRMRRSGASHPSLVLVYFLHCMHLILPYWRDGFHTRAGMLFSSVSLSLILLLITGLHTRLRSRTFPLTCSFWSDVFPFKTPLIAYHQRIPLFAHEKRRCCMCQYLNILGLNSIIFNLEHNIFVLPASHFSSRNQNKICSFAVDADRPSLYLSLQNFYTEIL